MITYKIMNIDNIRRTMYIRYSKPDYDDFFVQWAYEPPLSDAEAHKICVDGVDEAIHHWELQDTAEPFSLSTSDTGIIKNKVFDETPDYSTLTQTLEEVRTETEDTIRISFNVVPLSEEEAGMSIRQQRDDMLFQTDIHALADRDISDEMVAFRQALRDITDQDGFPFAVIWPVKPID